jgi:hypothetical protein
MHMDLAPYIDSLRGDLSRAAAAAGPEAQAHAERLLLALDPAVRMALMEALSDAAAEITQQLEAEAVEVRLKGREPQFVVSATQPTESAAAEPAEEDDEDSDAVARITVRIPESLKTRAEEAAADRRQSLNTWIVAAIRRATRDRAFQVDLDLGSFIFPPGAPQPPGPPGPPGRGRSGRRIQGWAR